MFLNLTPDTLSMMLLKSTSNTFLRWISNTNTVGDLEVSPIIVEKRMPDASKSLKGNSPYYNSLKKIIA